MDRNKKNVTNNPKDALKKLFIEAEKENGLQYIFTLLRVTGITCCKDPLIKLESVLKKQKFSSSSIDSTVQSCLFDGIEELLGMIGNLLNCSTGQVYKYCFFLSLYKGSFPNIIKPSVEQMLQVVKDRAMQTNHLEVASVIEHSSLASLFEEASKPLEHYENAKSFVQILISIYKEARLKFKGKPQLHKLARFDVLELMVNKVEGLYGFHLHFSNGGSAYFVRKIDSTESVNISSDRESELVPFVGDLDTLTEEWRVGEKKLYEIGLSGRYNKLGEWKPLVYPARKTNIIDSLQKKASVLSNDVQIQGILFYIMCTAYQVIEFVVMTDIEFPDKDLMFGNVMNLHRFYGSENLQNTIIYDGTFKLKAFDPEEIERAITMIDVTLNTMAFAYDASVQWRLKYKLVDGRKGFIKVKEKDFEVLKNIIDKFPRNKDELILHSAIDWYNRGVAARDVFAEFLCYYRVIEKIYNSIYNGEASFGLGFKKIRKDEAKQRSLDCIDKKYRQMYNEDKRRFVISAYTECIQGARAKTEQVLKLIFGEDSKYIKDLFEKPEDKKHSLYDIRNRIAHGRLTLLKKTDVELVRVRLWHIQRIAKDLIMRLSCSLKPSDKLPKWSRTRGLAISGYDPRAYLVVNTEDTFPEDVDWKIKPEWCV